MYQVKRSPSGKSRGCEGSSTLKTKQSLREDTLPTSRRLSEWTSSCRYVNASMWKLSKTLLCALKCFQCVGADLTIMSTVQTKKACGRCSKASRRPLPARKPGTSRWGEEKRGADVAPASHDRKIWRHASAEQRHDWVDPSSFEKRRKHGYPAWLNLRTGPPFKLHYCTSKSAKTLVFVEYAMPRYPAKECVAAQDHARVTRAKSEE